MKTMRKIIEIDENRCNGCGQCIVACAEGALKLVDGKAKLVGEILCDGIGACIGECPVGALKIVERPADAFSEEAVQKHLGHTAHEPSLEKGHATLPCGCPSSSIMTFTPGTSPRVPTEQGCADATSRLGHWPVKLQLLAPTTPFLKGSDMLLLADCCGIACPNLHERLLTGRTVAIACPKLDDVESHIGRLADILRNATPRTLTVVHMEVPCCTGLVRAAVEALARSGADIPLRHIVIGRQGEISAEEPVMTSRPASAGR